MGQRARHLGLVSMAVFHQIFLCDARLAAGENRAMADLRKQLTSKLGVNSKRMRIASYWKHGEVDHHEEITNS